MIPDKTYKNDYSAAELEALEKETRKLKSAYEEKQAESDHAAGVLQRQKEAQTKFIGYAVRGYRLEDNSESTHVFERLVKAALPGSDLGEIIQTVFRKEVQAKA